MTELNSTDLLHGFKAIAGFLGISARQAEYWSTTTDMPTFKIGRTVCARRGTLKEWLAKREAAGGGQ